MQLKNYQLDVLQQIRQYLLFLNEARDKAAKVPELFFPEIAWEKCRKTQSYKKTRDALGRPLPNFCMKIPTGGGKTLLAAKTLDLINTIYLKRTTGLVLWVVPSNAIYRQTLQQLKDKSHPYRQSLDISTKGHTLITEKIDRFTHQHVQENLVIMLMMLPSANRQTKEALRVFRDNSGFLSFFPNEDDVKAQQSLLSRFPNLDIFEAKNGFWGKQIKTSLGNVLRLMNPIVILDEGHKAYSELAQNTIKSLNPSIVVELSATPSHQSNILVNVPGRLLNDEEMIKLDLHLINKASIDWKDTLRSAYGKQQELEIKANEFEAITGKYIRPICLIQAERTGRDQRDGIHIHAEDVRDHLTRILGVPTDHIAVKTSETDELKDIDMHGGLLSRECPVRFIITKQALQEGWDCAFAYVLAILTNPKSKNALTQLVGRILRQPFAKKTPVRELNESYVYCFQQKAGELLDAVKRGFEAEGLGDLSNRIASSSNERESNQSSIEVRDKFRGSASRILLPVFVVKDQDNWRPVSYESDLSPRINWDSIDLSPINRVAPNMFSEKDIEHLTTLAEDSNNVIKQRKSQVLQESQLRADPIFLALQLSDIVPNPWMAHYFATKALKILSGRFDSNVLDNSFIGIIEYLREFLSKEKDKAAEVIFKKLLQTNQMRFLVISHESNFQFPKKAKASPPYLTKKNGMQLEFSLFEHVPQEDFNDYEKSVAWLLDGHKQMFFWYRNRAKQDYSIQGWRAHKVYPDFIISAKKDSSKKDYGGVYIVETKGEHLKGADDSEYKRKLFNLCNEKAIAGSWDQSGLGMDEKSLRFEIVASDEWDRRLVELLDSN